MKIFWKSTFSLFGLLLLASCATSVPRNVASANNVVARDVSTHITAKTPYTWKNVAWGGGYMTGIAIHPRNSNIIYVRTDMGTGYRWDEKTQSWIPLLDWISADDSNLLAPESVAVDASDPTSNTVFYSLGRYAEEWAKPDGDIVKSRDGGKTWKRAGLKLKIGANHDQRFGERLAVDPANGNIVLYASRGDGLWRSERAGEPGTWKRDTIAPTGDLKNRVARDPSGLSFLLFDASQGVLASPRRTKRLYLAAWNEGIYRSDDGGKSWKNLGGPKDAYRGALSSDGKLVVTHESGVSEYSNNRWSDITPSNEKNKRFVAVAVDPKNSQHIIVARSEWTQRLPLYRTTDGGQSWTAITHENSTFDLNGVEYLKSQDYNRMAAPAAIAFDPQNSKTVWFTDWVAAWRTRDIGQKNVQWQLLMHGHEQGAVLALLSTHIAPLISGAADADGYRHEKLDEYPAANHALRGTQWTNETTGFDFSESDPNFVARIAAYGWSRKEKGVAAFSTDNGATWKPFASQPEGAWGGRIAVASDGNSIVWLPADNAKPVFSLDKGASWQTSESAPAGTIVNDNIWNWNQPLCSDRGRASTFYLIHGQDFYRSNDGGKTWSKTATLSFAPRVVKAAPGMAGEVWIAGDGGILRSSNGGESFQKLSGVESAQLFAWGKSAPDVKTPTAFLWGKVAGRSGLFRSVDMGQTWTRIGGDNPAFATINTLEGDRNAWGRVYVGTNGRGIFYGEPR